MKTIFMICALFVFASANATDVIKLDFDKVSIGKINKDIIVVERDSFTPANVKLAYKMDVEVMVCKQIVWHDYPIDYHHPGFINPNQECVYWEKEIVTKKFAIRFNFKKAHDLDFLETEKFVIDLKKTDAHVIKGNEYDFKNMKFPVKLIKFIAK